MGVYRDRIFPWIMDRTDTEPLRTERARALAGAGGRILELGAGTGANFEHYPEAAASVVGIEPSAGMNRRADGRRPGGLPVRLVAADAEALPFPDRTFDTVVAILVLCSIHRPDLALAESRRVLAEGGRLVFLEHVGAPEPRIARWQRRLEPLWTRLACGCRLTRDTEAAIADAGFTIDRVERFWMPGVPRLAGRMIRGSAVTG